MVSYTIGKSQAQPKQLYKTENTCHYSIPVKHHMVSHYRDHPANIGRSKKYWSVTKIGNYDIRLNKVTINRVVLITAHSKSALKLFQFIVCYDNLHHVECWSDECKYKNIYQMTFSMMTLTILLY